jgi:hypothetical protein
MEKVQNHADNLRFHLNDRCEWFHVQWIAHYMHTHHVRDKFPVLITAHVNCARVLPLRIALASKLLGYSHACLNGFFTHTNCWQDFDCIFAYLPVLLLEHLSIDLLFIFDVLLNPW